MLFSVAICTFGNIKGTRRGAQDWEAIWDNARYQGRYESSKRDKCVCNESKDGISDSLIGRIGEGILQLRKENKSVRVAVEC